MITENLIRVSISIYTRNKVCNQHRQRLIKCIQLYSTFATCLATLGSFSFQTNYTLGFVLLDIIILRYTDIIFESAAFLYCFTFTLIFKIPRTALL